MKNTSFLIVSLLASTPVYGVSNSTEKTDRLRRSKDVYAIIGNFLPADEAMRLMHSNKGLKNHVKNSHYLGQTPGGHFHVYKMDDRVIAQRIPTTKYPTNEIIMADLEQLLRDNDIKARQLDLVSLDRRMEMKKLRPILDAMGAKTLTVKSSFGDDVDYEGIKVYADRITMKTDKSSLVLENIHADHLTLEPSTDIDLTVSGCDITTLVLGAQALDSHKVILNSDNGIKNVEGRTSKLLLDNRREIRNYDDVDNISLNTLPGEHIQLISKTPIEYGMTEDKKWKISTEENDGTVVMVENIDRSIDSSAFFGGVEQLINDKKIQGDILYISSHSHKPMTLPSAMIEALGVSLVIAQGVLHGDYSGKTVIIELPDTEEVTLGPLQADNLALYTGPKTKVLNLAGDVEQGGQIEGERIAIQPSRDITVKLPARGNFNDLNITSRHDVTIEDAKQDDETENTSTLPSHGKIEIKCSTFNLKGTRYNVHRPPHSYE